MVNIQADIEELEEGVLCQQMEMLKQDIRNRKVEALKKFWGHEDADGGLEQVTVEQAFPEESRRQGTDRRQAQGQWSGQDRRQGDRRVIGKFTDMVNRAQW